MYIYICIYIYIYTKVGVVKYAWVCIYAPVNVKSGKGREKIREFWDEERKGAHCSCQSECGRDWKIADGKEHK